MTRLASIIKTFEGSFLAQYGDTMLPSHYKALAAMKICRSQQSAKMLASCTACDERRYLPHSCGHRSCPHCQAHESQQWLERQLKKQVPADYFLVTFTLPAQFRSLAKSHQRKIYAQMIQCCWDTLKRFSQNDQALQGIPGAIAVLHTHNRQLGYHPHVHIVIPAAAIDPVKRLWRTKTTRRNSKADSKPFLFNHKALAKVFRAKMLQAITDEGLTLPSKYPTTWNVGCQSVGSGDKALVYLGRYLYRGVIQEKDVFACDNGNITFRYRNSKTRQFEFRTVTGEKFLWLLLQHVLPKGFRRTRNFGFLHPNSKQLIQVVQLLFKFVPNRALAWVRKRPDMVCNACGGIMKIIETRIPSVFCYSRGIPT